MINKYVPLISCALLLAGCGEQSDSSNPTGHAGAPSFASVYAAAEESLAQAAARRNVWSKTEEMLADAKAAYDEGRVDEAIELATEARLQAELAVAQADHEKEAWRSRVLTE
jgi:hypothetical protein